MKVAEGKQNIWICLSACVLVSYLPRERLAFPDTMVSAKRGTYSSELVKPRNISNPSRDVSCRRQRLGAGVLLRGRLECTSDKIPRD
jgi:hypothetical protein